MPNRLSGFWLTLDVVVAACACFGCALPQGFSPMTERDERRIYLLKHLSVTEGETMLADVVTRLGPPDYTEASGLHVGYSWELGQVIRHIWFGFDMLAIGPPDTSQVLRHLFILGVDDRGVIQWQRHVVYDSADGPLPTISEVVAAMTESR